jgi:hypothetical protein
MRIENQQKKGSTMRAPKILMAIGMVCILSTTSLISCGGTSKKTYTISGTVSGGPGAGVGVSLSGAATASTVTDATGAYTFSGLANGSYTVTPSLTDYTFAPVNIPVVVSNANKSGEDFVATVSFTISGTVSGDIAAGVGVSLSGAATASTVTDATGAYSFSGLANGSYTVTPSLTDFTFDPTSIPVVVSGSNIANQNFTATNEVCAKIGGTGAGECNSQTDLTVAACITYCNQFEDIVTGDAWSQIGSCILSADCDTAPTMLTTCLTYVASTITSDNLTVVENSLCENCQAGSENTACLSSIDGVLQSYGSYLSLIGLINTSTVDCLTTCYQTPSQPCLNIATLSNAYTQINTCLTQCQIPLQL